MNQPALARWLADLVLIVHFGFVVFVVGGLVMTWVGWWRGWEWVRRYRFRIAHVLAMGVVLAEALGGVVCPLTVWEDRLREMAGASAASGTSFIQRWIHQILFYDVSERWLTVAYALFFVLMVATFWLVPPRRMASTGRADRAG